MGYNRSLDLLAMSLAATQAGMHVKAANNMHPAASDVSASSAIDVICAANKKKKPAKKKTKSAFDMFAELEDVPGEEDEDETTAALRAALEDEAEEETAEAEEDVFKMKTESTVSASAKVRAARRALAEAEEEAEEEKEESSVFASARAARARRALAEAEEDIQVGEEERVEVPATRSKASFARALRNIAARQK